MMPKLALSSILIILGLHIGNYIDQNLINQMINWIWTTIIMFFYILISIIIVSKYLQKFSGYNEKTSILATNFSDAQVFFQISGNNTFYMLNKLTHFDFREKNFKAMTAAQTLVARIDCNIYRLENHMLISCNRSFADYFEDRLIDAVNF